MSNVNFIFSENIHENKNKLQKNTKIINKNTSREKNSKSILNINLCNFDSKTSKPKNLKSKSKEKIILNSKEKFKKNNFILSTNYHSNKTNDFKNNNTKLNSYGSNNNIKISNIVDKLDFNKMIQTKNQNDKIKLYDKYKINLNNQNKENNKTYNTNISKNLINLDKETNSNLEIELNNKNNELNNKKKELNLIKHNFNTKINLIEKENKNVIKKIENNYEILLSDVENINVDKKNNLDEITNKNYNNYLEQIIGKLYLELSGLKINTVNVSKHEEIIRELKNQLKIEKDETKQIYVEKIKELMNFYDKPEYKNLLENLSFYMKFKEKIEIKKDEISSLNYNFSINEYDICIDKIKLNLINSESEYLNGMMDLEKEYKEMINELKINQNDKFLSLENEINSKFDVIIYLNKEFREI